MWRTWKRVGGTLFAIGFLGSVWTAGLYYKYQRTLPRYPNYPTGSVYPLNVHGIVICQTRSERNWPNDFLYSSIGVIVMSGLMAAIYQKKFGELPMGGPAAKP
jgi:hypothetical protein